MPRIMYVTGMETVLRNLGRSGDKMGLAVQRGLVKGGCLLRNESQSIVPVQIGNLKASAYTRNIGGRGFDSDIVVGYTASYAVYVHEDLTKTHGKAFNVKHADEIAKHGEMSTSKTGREYWKASDPQGRAKGMWHPRGEDQQAKFLERPVRERRLDILKIVADEVRQVK